MAEIRRITRSDPRSQFQNVAPAGGTTFGILADTMEQAYDFLRPAALEQMTQYGAEVGREIARQQIGDPAGSFTLASSGGAVGGDFDAALRTSESGGNSQVVNSEGFGGLYQFGQPRLDDYNRIHGTSHTVASITQPGQEATQETIYQWHKGSILGELGGYVGTTVNGQTLDENAIVAMAHLGGTGGARQYIESGGAYNPADSNGTSLSDYAAKFGGGSITRSTSGGSPVGLPPPTLLRDADGNLTARLFSPLSGEFGQAANAAAGLTYRADIEVKAATDIMSMSQQFMLDPAGFAQASQEYLQNLVSQAPEMFREDVRATITQEVHRRYLGMVEEKQRDTFQRAENSSAALIDRYSSDLAQSYASGNVDQIAAADMRLAEVLRARETIPGASWTPEQSRNAQIAAREAGVELQRTRQREQQTTWRSSLDTIIKAAGAMRTASGEGILDNPAVRAAFPELVAEADAAIAVRDMMPSLKAATPADQQTFLDNFLANPVVSDWEVSMGTAIGKVVKESARLWKADPIAQAQTVLPPEQRPLPLPPFDPTNPTSFIDGLAARSVDAQQLVDQGYVTEKVMLSDAEATQIGALMSKDSPPEVRMAVAAAAVNALGDAAVPFLQEVKSDDPVLLHAAMMTARGGSAATAGLMMRGQAMLDEGLATAPSKATQSAAMGGDVSAALLAAGVPVDASSQVMKAATAIYAATVPAGPIDDATQAQHMAAAVQTALGQETTRGVTTGGVQTLGAFPTLLPVGVDGKSANTAILTAFGRNVSTWDRITSLGRVSQPQADPAIWSSAGVGWSAGSGPMLGGQPIDGALWDSGNLRLVPVPKAGAMVYRMEYIGTGAATDVRDASGNTYIFDMGALMEAAG